MPSNKTWNRRDVLGYSVGVFAALAMPFPAIALTDSEARDLIGKMIGDINSIINAGKPLSSMLRDFRRMFEKLWRCANHCPILAWGRLAKRQHFSETGLYGRVFELHVGKMGQALQRNGRWKAGGHQSSKRSKAATLSRPRLTCRGRHRLTWISKCPTRAGRTRCSTSISKVSAFWLPSEPKSPQCLTSARAISTR